MIDPTTTYRQIAKTEWLRRLNKRVKKVKRPELAVEGVLRRIVGLTLQAEGCQAAIGSRCRVTPPSGESIEAEVVGFADEKVFLMPTSDMTGLVPNSRVVPIGHAGHAFVGPQLLGRVLDGAGNPIDGMGELDLEETTPLAGREMNPLDRRPVSEPLDVGVRAINALLTVGRGQRMGLFAGSGVGKSVLLGMMTKFTTADVVVVGLIGERGREVKEFIQEILGEEGRRRAVVVAAPADTLPLMRLHGAMLATSIAEYFRDQGKQVLLLMDSLSRFAQAQREISLAVGEPPATKGYPPSVFAKLPRLVERAGNGDERGGSITAFYTVLAEGDDQNDPIADAARAILDGHIVLTRRLAEQGHYPAIDVEASVSRVMQNVTESAQFAQAQRFKRIYSTYSRNEDLINVGAYRAGSDPRIDEAIKMQPMLAQFLRQGIRDSVDYAGSLAELGALFGR